MQKIELSVHEFMSIMGALDEARGNEKQEENTIYDEWFSQWKTLDERLENLDMMDGFNLGFLTDFTSFSSFKCSLMFSMTM